MIYTWQNLLVIGFFLLITLPAGYQIESVGTLFVGDMLLISFASFGFVPLVESWRSRGMKCFVWLLILFPPIAALLDHFHGVSLSDMFRGGGRNVVFLAGILVVQFLIQRVGLHLALWLVSGFYISQPVVAVWLQPELFSDMAFVIKYYWGTYLLIPILLLLRNWPRIISVVMVSGGLVAFLLFDCRGDGALWIISGVIFEFRSNLINFGLKKALLISLLGVGICMGFILDKSIWENLAIQKADRWETSNSERMDIAIDAAISISNNILTGTGSWTHAKNYYNEKNPTQFLSVHSTILMLTVEYGITGFAVSFGCFAIIAIAIIKLLRTKITRGHYGLNWEIGPLLVMLVDGFYILLMIPLNGATRFFLGFSVGVALYVLKKCGDLRNERNPRKTSNLSITCVETSKI